MSGLCEFGCLCTRGYQETTFPAFNNHRPVYWRGLCFLTKQIRMSTVLIQILRRKIIRHKYGLSWGQGFHEEQDILARTNRLLSFDVTLAA
jgi:hypothetical protein